MHHYHGDADTECFDKNCHTWEHGVLKKSMARVAMIPKKKINDPSKERKRLIVCMIQLFLRSCQQCLPPNVNLTQNKSLQTGEEY